MTILTLWSTVNKNRKSLLECPMITAFVAAFDAKSSMTRNCGNCAWMVGTGLLMKYLNKHMAYICKFHICLFLSVLIKTNHTAHMYSRIKTLKHNVGTTLQLSQHGCKNLTHTSKTRHVKRTQLIELKGSRFGCFLLFQTAKNRTQWNRRVKWCEVQIRTIARKSSIGGYYICAGWLDILKNWWNLTDL